jgi:hypothetical protein
MGDKSTDDVILGKIEEFRAVHVLRGHDDRVQVSNPFLLSLLLLLPLLLLLLIIIIIIIFFFFFFFFFFELLYVQCVSVSAALDLVASGSADGTCVLHNLRKGN